MPSYLPPLRGVTLSEAEAEAAAIAPVQRAMLDCLEIWRNDFTAPARVVVDKQAYTSTLEATAPRNAGEAVTWQPVAAEVVWPSETDDAAAPRAQLQIDGVSAVLTEQLDRASDSLEPTTVILRRYASDDPSGPSRLPVLVFELTDVRVTEQRVTATCISGDPANRRFPARAYTRARYPGLAAR